MCIFNHSLYPLVRKNVGDRKTNSTIMYPERNTTSLVSLNHLKFVSSNEKLVGSGFLKINFKIIYFVLPDLALYLIYHPAPTIASFTLRCGPPLVTAT